MRSYNVLHLRLIIILLNIWFLYQTLVYSIVYSTSRFLHETSVRLSWPSVRVCVRMLDVGLSTIRQFSFSLFLSVYLLFPLLCLSETVNKQNSWLEVTANSATHNTIFSLSNILYSLKLSQLIISFHRMNINKGCYQVSLY